MKLITTFTRQETIPLIKYVEKHTELVTLQLKFYNMIIIAGGGVLIWAIDNDRKNVDKRFEQVDKRFEQVDKRLETIELDLKEIKNLMLLSRK